MLTLNLKFFLLLVTFCNLQNFALTQSVSREWKLYKTLQDTSSFCLNGSIAKEISFKDKLGNINSFSLYSNRVYNFSVKRVDDSKWFVQLRRNQSISAMYQMSRDSVDGLMLLFDKKGRIALALIYERSELVFPLYFRKEKLLKGYLKMNGTKSPFTFSTTTSFGPGCDF